MSDANSTSISNFMLTVRRLRRTEDAIFGEITISGDSTFKAYSMERIAVAIPPGTYNGRLRFSPHFGMTLPGIDVPNRTDIEIHPANFPSQLEGCIAIGSAVDNDALDNSRAAFHRLMAALPDSFIVTVSE